MGFNRVNRGCSAMRCYHRFDRGSLAAKKAEPEIERYERLRAVVVVRRVVIQTLTGKKLAWVMPMGRLTLRQRPSDGDLKSVA